MPPSTLLTRYRELIAIRCEERLTEEEYAELLELGDTVEAFHLQRMIKLAELAKLRHVPLIQLMNDLTIHPLPI